MGPLFLKNKNLDFGKIGSLFLKNKNFGIGKQGIPYEYRINTYVQLV